jgi:hypothetical protein
MTSLQLGPKNLVELTDLTNRHHHLFFFGDLNYRLDGIDRDVSVCRLTLLNNKLKLHLCALFYMAFVMFHCHAGVELSDSPTAMIINKCYYY